MQLSISQAETIVQSGIAALQAGDAQGAKGLFEQAIAAGFATPALWLLQAQACKFAADLAGEGAALDQVLAANPRELNALIMKGDWYGRQGERLAAAAHYRTALNAGANSGPHPPQTQKALERAETAWRQSNGALEDHLHASLAREQLAPQDLSGRVREALDILCEKKQVFLQEPTAFYFPGLPQRQFYERAEFEWVAQVEQAAPAIRAELLAILEEEGAFTPYVEADADRPRPLHAMLGDPSWSAYHILKSGKPVPSHAEKCPRTLEALRGAPLPAVRGRSPMALFSLLRPGAHIKPHNGLLNCRLICHLPLIVPPGCAIRVGNEVREWQEGKMLIFDDSIEHEAWNQGEELRVILLFEIWRPEIVEGERRALTTIFEAITDYGPQAAETL
ncbi:MAG TPA: aspartyl/asparaginyl beta-hydroxylase domain-containing protein [Allosphingosinicella sp.]